MGEAIQSKSIKVYADANGREPYFEWFKGLKDVKGRARIESRLQRLAVGHFGDTKSVGEGVSELRMFFGPGYRVYYGEDQGNIVVLLCGGDKGSQKKDIQLAKNYWQDYLNNER